MNCLHTLVALIALSSSPTFAAPGNVWVVDENGTGDFAEIQPAIDAAASGDTILILPGNYSGFVVDAKSLSLAGDTAQFIRVNGVVRVRNLVATEHVTLSSLNIREGLRVNDCAGHVGLADCFLLASGLNELWTPAAHGSHRIVNSDDVLFARSTLRGRDGGTDNSFCADVQDAFDGESALYLDDSTVALYSCEVVGGMGGPSGDGSCLFCLQAFQGDGGDGVHAVNQGFVYIDDTAPLGGAKGMHAELCSSTSNTDGAPVALSGASQLEIAASPVLAFEASAIVRENSLLSVTVHGPIGAQAWMLLADEPDWRPFGGTVGLLHLNSQSLSLKLLGTIPASGELTAPMTPPAIQMGMKARRLFVQVFANDGANGRLLGTSTGLDVLDPAF